MLLLLAVLVFVFIVGSVYLAAVIVYYFIAALLILVSFLWDLARDSVRRRRYRSGSQTGNRVTNPLYSRAYPRRSRKGERRVR